MAQSVNIIREHFLTSNCPQPHCPLSLELFFSSQPHCPLILRLFFSSQPQPHCPLGLTALSASNYSSPLSLSLSAPSASLSASLPSQPQTNLLLSASASLSASPVRQLLEAVLDPALWVVLLDAGVQCLVDPLLGGLLQPRVPLAPVVAINPLVPRVQKIKIRQRASADFYRLNPLMSKSPLLYLYLIYSF